MSASDYSYTIVTNITCVWKVVKSWVVIWRFDKELLNMPRPIKNTMLMALLGLQNAFSRTFYDSHLIWLTQDHGWIVPNVTALSPWMNTCQYMHCHNFLIVPLWHVLCKHDRGADIWIPLKKEWVTDQGEIQNA